MAIEHVELGERARAEFSTGISRLRPVHTRGRVE